jgi:hypothetical protein
MLVELMFLVKNRRRNRRTATRSSVYVAFEKPIYRSLILFQWFLISFASSLKKAE